MSREPLDAWVRRLRSGEVRGDPYRARDGVYDEDVIASRLAHRERDDARYPARPERPRGRILGADVSGLGHLSVTKDPPRSVYCPTCGAGPGRDCSRDDGGSGHHPDRVSRAETRLRGGRVEDPDHPDFDRGRRR